MKLPKSHLENMALRHLAMEDLMAQSDAQLRQEAAEDGEDVDALATAVRSALRATAANVLRQRLADAKQRMMSTAHPVKATKYPTLDTLKRRREWAAMTARQCRAGLLIRLEIVDELPRLFAQKRNCPPPLQTPHTIGIYRSPTVEQVLSDLRHWDEKRTINALRAA